MNQNMPTLLVIAYSGCQIPRNRDGEAIAACEPPAAVPKQAM